MSIKYSDIIHTRNIVISGLNEIKILINDEIQAANLENIKQVFVIGSDCTLNGCEIKAGNHRIE